MRRLLPLILLGACATTTASAVPLERLTAKPDFPCAVTVEFTSACCGINRAAYDAVTGQAPKLRGVIRAAVWAWGREGEQTLCLVTSHGDEAFAALSARKYPTANSASTWVVRGEKRVKLEP
jgi:hypothetical protein